MLTREMRFWNEYKNVEDQVKVLDGIWFESTGDLSSTASYITNRRFDNPELFTEPCKCCEGYGIVNEVIVQDDNEQYLVGSICKNCNGLGRFDFIEAIKFSKRVK